MNPSSSMEQQFMTNILKIVEKNLHDENFGVNELASELGMSRATLHRKVKSVIKKSVSEFIRETRLKRAHGLLEKKHGTVSEIAYNVGFSSVPYFSRCFHKHFGYTPGDVLKGLYSIENTNSNKKKDVKGSSTKVLKFVFSVLLFLIAVASVFFFIQNKKSLSDTTLLILKPKSEDIEVNKVLNILWQQVHGKIHELENVYVISELSTDIWSNKQNLKLKDVSRKGIEYVIVLNGSILEDEFRTWIKLTESKNEEVLLSKSYDLGKNSELTFGTITDIVRTIAETVEIKISDVEIKTLETFPTYSQAALFDYNMGEQQLKEYSFDLSSAKLESAKRFFKQAIHHDAEYAQAYTQLANISSILAKNSLRRKEEKQANSLYDSAFYYAKMALNFKADEGLALNVLGDYFLNKGEVEKSAEYYESARKYMDTGYGDYQFAMYERISAGEIYSVIKDFYTYLDNKPEEEFTDPNILREIIWHFYYMGFTDLAKINAREFYELTNDQWEYEAYLLEIDMRVGNFEEAEKKYLEYFNYLPDTFIMLREMVWVNLYLHQDSLAYEYLLRSEKQEIKEGRNPRIDPAKIYLYSKFDRTIEAKSLAESLINSFKDEVGIGNEETSGIMSGMIAFAYAGIGEYEKALEFMKINAEKKYIFYIYLQMYNDLPHFDAIRNTDEFQGLVQQMEIKYKKEHDRIANLLKSRGEPLN